MFEFGVREEMTWCIYFDTDLNISLEFSLRVYLYHRRKSERCNSLAFPGRTKEHKAESTSCVISMGRPCSVDINLSI